MLLTEQTAPTSLNKSPFSPLFYGIRDVTSSDLTPSLRHLHFQSPILRDSWCYWSPYRENNFKSNLSVPYFTGFVMLQMQLFLLRCKIVKLSVPYFTGFVMLLFIFILNNMGVINLSVPYFTGFVMLLASLCGSCGTIQSLSVPYFTGFVMLQRPDLLNDLHELNFQSPILRDSWCY